MSGYNPYCRRTPCKLNIRDTDCDFSVPLPLEMLQIGRGEVMTLIRVHFKTQKGCLEWYVAVWWAPPDQNRITMGIRNGGAQQKGRELKRNWWGSSQVTMIMCVGVFLKSKLLLLSHHITEHILPLRFIATKNVGRMIMINDSNLSFAHGNIRNYSLIVWNSE